MPFTPFHFGPCATIAIPFRRYFDLPVFLLTNVLIDLEVLVIWGFGINLPLHGQLHSFTLGSLAAILLAGVCHLFRRGIASAMRAARYPYESSFSKMLWTSLAGVWSHVVMDSTLYTDIRPFFPSAHNPFYALISEPAMYRLCALSFIPAVLFYVRAIKSGKKKA